MMKRLPILNMLSVAAAACLWISGAAAAGQLRAWGWDADGEVSMVPAGNTYVAVAAGDAHGLGLRSDGTIAAWGQNVDGECTVPAGIYRYVAAGADFSLAIRTNGSIAAWGRNADGEVSNVPAGNNFVAVDGGEAFAVALRSDGTIVAWGNDNWGQVSKAPAGLGFKAVVAGDCHGVALQADGSLVAWGYPAAIQGKPTSGTFTAIAAGGSFCVALRSDGTLVWWGSQNYDYGLARVPTGNDYVAVAAGYLHCLALKKDGSIVGWGAGTETSAYPHRGQANPPAGNNYAALACGLFYSVALVGDINSGGNSGSGSSSGGGGGSGTVPPKSGISDNFDDNKQASLWSARNSDRNVCWLEEVNGRLELRATTSSHLSTAYYLSNGWKLDPANDFSFKVDFHYSLNTNPLGWLAVGLTPDVNSLDGHHVEFGPGCSGYFSHTWFEAINGEERSQSDFMDRPESNGVLYVSYDAKTDKLYLSNSGYGSAYAWGTVAGLLHGAWAGKPLWVYIGGGSDGLETKSGDAYLDSFVIDAGGPTISLLSPVYRFWSPSLEDHFYTIDPNEKDFLTKQYAKVWTYEKVAFQAAPKANAPGLAPVYRFWSLKKQGHFYTLDANEKKLLIEKYPKLWQYEGIAFYAYPQGAQPATSKPVYRIVRPKKGTHFYTIDAAERDWLLKTYPKDFTAEGVAFYAFE